ncbi:MAG: hypothetical protein ACREMY_19505, partial [bacterium]
MATKIQNAEATADERRQASDKEALALKAVDEGASKTRQALEHASLEHAAAYIGAGLKPGDKCPVCSTILPKGFTPSKHAGLEFWKAQLNEVEKKLTAARAAAAIASAAHTSALAELTQLKAQQPEIIRSEHAARKALHRLLPAADLDQNDLRLMAPLIFKFKALEATAKEAAKVETEAAVNLGREQSRLDAADSALATNGATLMADEAENAKGLRVARDFLTRMPAFARPAPSANAEQLAPTSMVLDALLVGARKDESALQALRASQQKARSNLVILESRYEKEVADPKRRAHTTLVAILGQLNSARALLAQTPFSGPDEGATVAATATYA